MKKICINDLSGVILDHDYLGEEYESTFELMKQVIERVIREDLKVGGLQVKYYSWSRINFNKGLHMKNVLRYALSSKAVVVVGILFL